MCIFCALTTNQVSFDMQIFETVRRNICVLITFKSLQQSPEDDNTVLDIQ